MEHRPAGANRNYRLWYNYNIDDAVIQGVELTATWYATPELTLRGNYTYTHSEQKTGDYEGFPWRGHLSIWPICAATG